jgi:serine/threonine protein kinase
MEEVLHIRRGKGADEQLAADLASLLRRRLILVTACVLAISGIVHLGANLGLFRPPSILWVELAVFYVPLMIFLFILVVRSTWSVFVLRIFELCIFGITALSFATWQWWSFRHGSLHSSGLDAEDTFALELVADGLTFPWFTLITFYGACIPNSGRRCAVVVSALTTLAFVSIGIICWDDLHLGTMSTTFTKAAIWLSIACIIAIAGSNRLQALQREALEARDLGQYTLKRQLGKGGMGEVFLAEHRLLRRPCALKLIRTEKADDPVTLVRFQREVKAMATLTHHNTVRVFDYGFTDHGVFYYVMEHLSGMTLQELVDRHGPVPPARAMQLIRQVCGALHEAHQRNLLHRDIKPSNIFVGERGLAYDTVKLLDFGLVQHVGITPEAANHAPEALRRTIHGPVTLAGAVPGTPLYMSPEQASNAPLDARSDIYSLGLVAYFLLTGLTPFRRDTIENTIAARLSDAVPPLLDVCPAADVDLNSVIMRCLERDSAARYPDIDQLANALAQCSCSNRWTPANAASWWRLNVPDFMDLPNGTVPPATPS